MKQIYMLMLLTFVAVFGLIGMFSNTPFTGSVVQEEQELTLLVKIQAPCFCAEAGNITDQQVVFYNIVESAEMGVTRNQISEQFAISLLNKTVENQCMNCIRLQQIRNT